MVLNKTNLLSLVLELKSLMFLRANELKQLKSN